jgi:hypothetical protein
MTYSRLTVKISLMHCLLPDRHTGEGQYPVNKIFYWMLAFASMTDYLKSSLQLVIK